MSPNETLVDMIAEAVAKRLGATGTPKARLLSVAAAGEYLSRSPSAIRHLINQGKLPTVAIDSRIMLDIRDLDRIIEESKR
jgi:hypothetical protein